MNIWPRKEQPRLDERRPPDWLAPHLRNVELDMRHVIKHQYAPASDKPLPSVDISAFTGATQEIGAQLNDARAAFEQLFNEGLALAKDVADWETRAKEEIGAVVKLTEGIRAIRQGLTSNGQEPPKPEEPV
jgi:hypothetical protein